MKAEDFATAFEKLNRMVPDRARSATVAIFAAKSDTQQLFPFGTGTLLCIGHRRFLVTAAHVRSEQKTRGFDFLCSGTRKGDVTALVQSNWYLYRNLDVAVFELTEQNVFDFEANDFLRLADVDINVDVSAGIFAVFGLPACWSDSSLDANAPPIKAKALQFITHPYSGRPEVLQDFDPSIHIALEASEEDHRNYDGSDTQWPDAIDRFLPGISGCGIWKLCHEFDPTSVPDSSNSRLVAVETAVYSETRIISVIKGTKWSAVAGLIQVAFPDLRPAFEMVWPSSNGW